MCNTKYQLADSATVYDDLQGSLVVILGQQGRVCRFRYSQQALDLLEHLQQASTPQDIINDFSQYTQSSILSALEKMISAGIVKPATSHHREVRCLLIGCGSIGSHIFGSCPFYPYNHLFLSIPMLLIQPISTDKIIIRMIQDIRKQVYYLRVRLDLLKFGAFQIVLQQRSN